jgi:hypothetical protein
VPDGPGPARQQQDSSLFTQDGQERVALLCGRKIKGAHQAAAPHVRDQVWETRAKLGQLVQEPGTRGGCLVKQPVALDDLQQPAGAAAFTIGVLTTRYR